MKISRLKVMGGGFEPYSAPSADVYEIFAERGFADSAIYKEPDFGWDDNDEDTFE